MASSQGSQVSRAAGDDEDESTRAQPLPISTFIVSCVWLNDSSVLFIMLSFEEEESKSLFTSCGVCSFEKRMTDSFVCDGME